MSDAPIGHRPTLDGHLFGPGPKRILALDGGGTLGVIEIAFLERIEQVLRDQHGDPGLRLCDYFDLIGGTSTGALIATALALGKSAAEVKQLYFSMGPKVFRKRLIHIPLFHKYLQYPFRAHALTTVLEGVAGERELQSEDLLTGLAIISKRLDTASPWVLTNNPRSRYWRYDPGNHAFPFIDNSTFKLREVLRASTAAPLAFRPKEILIAEKTKHPATGEWIDPEIGLFVDGGLSPHNNPALKMLMLAGVRRYGFSWPLGADELSITSIGSGWYRPRLQKNTAGRMFAFRAAAKGARGAVWDSQVHALMMLQWMSNPVDPWYINSEVEDLNGDVMGMKGGSPGLVTFQRFDVNLDLDWIRKAAPQSKFVAGLLKIDIGRLTHDDAFTDPGVMDLAYGIARDVAAEKVRAEHFPQHFKLDRMNPEPPFVVGVVGHRPNRLPDAEMPRIRQQLQDVLAEIQATRQAGSMVLMTGLAEGTDRIAARMALDRGWHLVGSLPFSRARYVKDFATEASRAEFDGLMAKAARIVEAPRADTYADQNLGYAEQGLGLVAAAGAIVTVWDGQGAHGTGGTAEVVANARARGLTVYWISTAPGAELKRL